MSLLLELLWSGRHRRRKRWLATRGQHRDQAGGTLARGDVGQIPSALDHPVGHVSAKRIRGKSTQARMIVAFVNRSA